MNEHLRNIIKQSQALVQARRQHLHRLNDVLPIQDQHLIVEALRRLRESKQESLDAVHAAGHTGFTPHDFGIPHIDALLQLFGDAEEVDA